MQSTNIQWVYKQIADNGFKWYSVKNSTGHLVLDEREEDATPEKARQQVETFLEMNKGVYTIEFRDTPKPRGGHNSQKYAFTINNMDNSSAPGIGTVQNTFGNGLGGSENAFYQMLKEQMDKKELMQSELIAQQIAHMQKMNELQLEQLKMKMELDSKKSDDGLNGMAMQVIGSILGGGFTPSGGIAGFGDAPIDTATMNNTSEMNKAEQAIVDLMKLDPDFENNIVKLAKLAKNNPAMYKQAITMLKSMA